MLRRHGAELHLPLHHLWACAMPLGHPVTPILTPSSCPPATPLPSATGP